MAIYCECFEKKCPNDDYGYNGHGGDYFSELRSMRKISEMKWYEELCM